ncbi:MAG: 4-(cytidine 5'-diphospho)-2-C-methyl-D-erythritol kinase [Clostridia bacterium]|nr:4-(cytidine 5'-diphospho)-2-C-methyl-D-erythritol kinase [Clostridia bacterium]
MQSVKIKAYAKINLTLEIQGVEKGYHLLDSLVASIDLHDVITLKKRKDRLSSVTMKGMGSESIPPEKNNALKAAEAFSETFGVFGVDITIYKNIPLGAGLGGSSADISGVLLGMAKLYGITDFAAVETLADSLGSDTRYMLTGGYARMQGRGEKITPLNITQPLHLLLICPDSSVSAGACYQKYDTLPKTLQWRESQTENCIAALQKNQVNEVGRYLTNDLFVPALHLNGEVEQALLEAQSFAPLGACMTGSGSCVFALFESKELCEWAKSRYKGKFRAFTAQTVASKTKLKFRNPFALGEDGFGEE